MSSYVVSDMHISAILDGVANVIKEIRVRDGQYSLNTEEDKQTIGQMLLKDNYKGVNRRYKRRSKAHPFTYTKTKWVTKYVAGGCPNILETYKLIECLMYNSCDHPRWEWSESFRFLTECQNNLTKLYITNTSRLSDGDANYDNCPWSI